LRRRNREEIRKWIKHGRRNVGFGKEKAKYLSN